MTCTHPDVEPVIVRDNKHDRPEVVGNICVDCLDQLPKQWGCTDCEWVEISNLAGLTVATFVGESCPRHR